MLNIAFVLLIVIQSAAVLPSSQDEVRDALAHAEALYYGARFGESIQLLTRVDESLKAQPGRTQERINTKLRLALAHIGLNENSKAKAYLVELYLLSPDYVLEAEQFSPKVIAVATEAKAEQTKVQCQSAQEEIRRHLGAGNTKAVLDLDRLLRSRCPVLATIEPEAAESFFKTGVTAYKHGEYSSALSSFEAALTLSPEHELALQYIDLTQNKLQLTQDRLVLQWQRNFDTRQLTAAAADYRQIMSSDKAESAAAMNRVKGEYRKALSALVETWNRTCPSGDSAAMKAIRTQISELLPEPSFGEDIRAQMKVCPEPNKNVATNGTPNTQTETAGKLDQAASTINGCLEMQPQLVLARVKKRVDPVITNELRYYLKNTAQVTVKVKARISESGDVTVTGLSDGNPILNNVVASAISEWKFTPIRDQKGVRCVETEIPVLLKLAQ